MKKHRIIEIYLTLGALLVITLAGVISYKTSFTDPVSKFLKSISPAIMVREQWVSVNGLEKAKAVVKNLDASASQSIAADQLVKQKKMEILRGQLKVAFQQQQVVDEFVYYTTNRSQEYRRLIADYFDNQEGLFIDQVIRPTALENALILKYNADFTENKTAFDRIRSIQRQLQAGAEFEDLAKEQSDDKLTGQFGGDLGFFELSELIPELKNRLKTATVGQVYDQIVISRYGYHLLYPIQTIEEDDKTLWQVRHILVETHGFDQWFASQTSSIPVWVIKN
jgi:parvulin-like peptidyl-prolyl isomerase